MVRVGTSKKLAHLHSSVRLDFFLESLFAYAVEFRWDLRAWAVLENHYHFIAASPPEPGLLAKFLGRLHMQTVRQLNMWDNAPARKVWFQFGIVISPLSVRIWPGSIMFIRTRFIMA